MLHFTSTCFWHLNHNKILSFLQSYQTQTKCSIGTLMEARMAMVAMGESNQWFFFKILVDVHVEQNKTFCQNFEKLFLFRTFFRPKSFVWLFLRNCQRNLMLSQVITDLRWSMHKDLLGPPIVLGWLAKINSLQLFSVTSILSWNSIF